MPICLQQHRRVQMCYPGVRVEDPSRISTSSSRGSIKICLTLPLQNCFCVRASSEGTRPWGMRSGAGRSGWASSGRKMCLCCQHSVTCQIWRTEISEESCGCAWRSSRCCCALAEPILDLSWNYYHGFPLTFWQGELLVEFHKFLLRRNPSSLRQRNIGSGGKGWEALIDFPELQMQRRGETVCVR